MSDKDLCNKVGIKNMKRMLSNRGRFVQNYMARLHKARAIQIRTE